MKRIKSVNGYTIYEATSARDEANYNCRVGSYNIYISSDIRDFGLSNSYPEYEDIDSLAVAEAMCGASKYAVAVDLAEEISGSTAQDMDLVLEIERLLESGMSVEGVRDHFDEDLHELDELGERLAAVMADAQTVSTDDEPDAPYTHIEPPSRDRKADLFMSLLWHVIDTEYEDGNLIEILRGLRLTDDEIRYYAGDLVDETKLAPVGLDRGGAQPVHVEYSDGSDGFEEPRFTVVYDGVVFPEDYTTRSNLNPFVCRNYHVWGKAFDLYAYCERHNIDAYVKDNAYGVAFAKGEWN